MLVLCVHRAVVSVAMATRFYRLQNKLSTVYCFFSGDFDINLRWIEHR